MQTKPCFFAWPKEAVPVSILRGRKPACLPQLGSMLLAHTTLAAGRKGYAQVDTPVICGIRTRWSGIRTRVQLQVSAVGFEPTHSYL